MFMCAGVTMSSKGATEELLTFNLVVVDSLLSHAVELCMTRGIVLAVYHSLISTVNVNFQ